MDSSRSLVVSSPCSLPAQPLRGQDTGEPMEIEAPAPPRRAKRRLRPPYTMEKIFRDFTFRRVALIRALTTDADALFHRCDPGMKPLYLYGHTDGSWELRLPELYLPPGRPEPALGINLVRDKMKQHEWLQQIARHCDAWLINISFFLGPYFEAKERQYLFTMINDLQTVHETVIASDMYRRLCHQEKKRSGVVVEENDEIDDEDKVCSDDKSFCASCGDRYHTNAFWIGCDFCDRWFHGKCVNISSEQAKCIRRYECPECRSERLGHDYDEDPMLSKLFKRY